MKTIKYKTATFKEICKMYGIMEVKVKNIF